MPSCTADAPTATLPPARKFVSQNVPTCTLLRYTLLVMPLHWTFRLYVAPSTGWFVFGKS
ncbi:MAG: hypothetical protein BWY59_00515 [Verrucomicrobia bacterium ADurb.Bin345]|nr:MAG: hypothetical protein BWY59_00515 [Verrucomicrobia bacterium ADurb.Bin345]